MTTRRGQGQGKKGSGKKPSMTLAQLRSLLEQGRIKEFNAARKRHPKFRGEINLRGVNLDPEIYDYKGVSLSYANLARTNLSKDGVERNFEAADFSHANLTEASLRRCNLRDALFSHTKLYRTDMSGTISNETTYVRVDAREADFSHAYLNAIVRHSDLRRAKFFRSQTFSEKQLLIDYCDLTDADFSFAGASGLGHLALMVRNSNLTRVNFPNANISWNGYSCTWDSNDFTDTTVFCVGGRGFKGSFVPMTQPACNDRGANHGKHVFRGIRLHNADLGRPTLHFVDLTGATFAGCRLASPQLYGANLTGATFESCVLDFGDAALQGADFTGVLLVNTALPADYSKLAGARGWETVRGLDPHLLRFIIEVGGYKPVTAA